MENLILEILSPPGLDKFASLAAKIILCSKGACELAVPIGVIFGGMSGIDELRKAKGLDPIFLPTLADIIIPDSDLQREMKQSLRGRYNEANLTRIHKAITAYEDEIKISLRA